MIANLETHDTFSHLDDLAGEISVHNKGMFDLGEHDVTGDLFELIERVDGDRVILNNDLVLTR
jgi:hypothetical protein